MFKQNLILSLCLLLTSLVSLNASAEPVDQQAIEKYVEMDLAVKQATLDGIKERVILMHLQATSADDLAHDASIQKEVSSIYRHYNTNAGKAVHWAGQHKKAIQHWLEQHPEFQQRYEDMAAELIKLSAQLPE